MHFSLSSPVGRLRLLGFLEGLSLLLLVFIAMPIKYGWGNPGPVRIIGGAHGLLFVLFVLSAIQVAVAQSWRFWTTAQVVLSSFVPFGTFYIDSKILKHLPDQQ